MRKAKLEWSRSKGYRLERQNVLARASRLRTTWKNNPYLTQAHWSTQVSYVTTLEPAPSAAPGCTDRIHPNRRNVERVMHPVWFLFMGKLVVAEPKTLEPAISI
jgi:hypothetical protein